MYKYKFAFSKLSKKVNVKVHYASKYANLPPLDVATLKIYVQLKYCCLLKDNFGIGH